jgi:hypothetical protein
MAAATLTKFVPALLALQFLAVRRGRSRYALALCAALAAMLAWPLATSSPAQFVDSTFGYQLIQRGGGTEFSIWTYIPQLATLGRALLAATLVLLALTPLLRTGGRLGTGGRLRLGGALRRAGPLRSVGRPGPADGDPRQDAALAAALLLGGQLLLGYWFYSYLTWCYPLLIIAIMRSRGDDGPGDSPGTSLGGSEPVADDRGVVRVGQRPDRLESAGIALGDPLMLAQVLRPGRDDELLDDAVGVSGVPPDPP